MVIFPLERVFEIVTGYSWFLSKLRVVLITGTYVKSHFFCGEIVSGYINKIYLFQEKIMFFMNPFD